MSNEELQKQLEELTNKFNELKQAHDLDHNKLMSIELDKIFVDMGYNKISGVSSYGSDLERTVTVLETPYQFIIPENPINTATIKASDGNYYRILLYSLT